MADALKYYQPSQFSTSTFNTSGHVQPFPENSFGEYPQYLPVTFKIPGMYVLPKSKNKTSAGF